MKRILLGLLTALLVWIPAIAGGPQQALLMVSGSGSGLSGAAANAFPGSSFTTTSTSYTNLLNGSGGSAITVTIDKKQTATGVLIRAGAGITVGTSTQVTLGVNDGSTDYDLGQKAIDGPYRTVEGATLITGLSAGSKTFTLRIKITGSTALDFCANCSAYIVAQEVDTSKAKSVMAFHIATAFTTSSTSYVDLLRNAGGSDFSISITKGAGTDLIAQGGTGASSSVANETLFLAAGDGTTDWELGRNRLFSGSAIRLSAGGTQLITGLGAGTYTIKLRVKNSGGNLTTFNTTQSSHLSVLEGPLGKALEMPGAGFTFNSSSYVNMLDVAAGNTYQVVYNKASPAAQTKLIAIVSATLTGNTATNSDVTLGVNDGSTDYDAGRLRVTNTFHRHVIGAVELPGLSAGNQTITLRAKSSASTQINLGLNVDSASIAVYEVDV